MSGRPADPGPAIAVASRAWICCKCDGRLAMEAGSFAVGTTTPNKGSSVRAVASVSAAPTSCAAASRAVSALSCQRRSMVLSMEV